MTDLSITPQVLEDSISPEMNLYVFFRGVAADVDHLQREVLEFLVAAGTSRGWFPTLGAVIDRFTEHEARPAVEAAVAKLQRQRLLVADGQRIVSILGGITGEKTRFSAMTDDHVPFRLASALDALTIAPMLQKAVEITTSCAVTGAPIRFKVDPQGHLVDSKPHSMTAFIAGWDGRAPLADSVVAGSHFFESDEKLHEWQVAHGDPVGMPLTQDTLRSVGMEMAVAIAELYTRMSIR